MKTIFLNAKKVGWCLLFIVFIGYNCNGQSTNVLKTNVVGLAFRVMNLEYERQLFPKSSLSFALASRQPVFSNGFTLIYYGFLRYYPLSKPNQLDGFYFGGGFFGIIEESFRPNIALIGGIIGYHFSLLKDELHIELGVAPQFAPRGLSSESISGIIPVPIVNVGYGF